MRSRIVFYLKKGVIVLPHRRNAIKALRQNKKRHFYNLDIKSDLRHTVKKFQDLVAQKNKAEAQATLQMIFKKFDKAAKIHLIHKNTAARRKSRFSKLLARIA